VTTTGRYVRLDDVALDWPPPPLLILVGAVGVKTLELTGEVADGTILTSGSTPDDVRAARLAIDRGRALAGRTTPHPITAYLIATTGPDAVERLHRDLAVWKLDPAADVGVAGDAQAVADGVRRWAEAGADTVVLQPTADEPDVEGFIRFAVDEVKPLLSSV
jgi:alkanesulfonate monooxygenase SsuD/methylene tetrahydromethanopterin reductase-like flavin-dependent oxidoreductase (luciferase family)